MHKSYGLPCPDPTKWSNILQALILSNNSGLNAQSSDEEIFLSFGKCEAQQTSMGRQNDTGNPLNKPQGKKEPWKRNPTPVIITQNWSYKCLHAILQKQTETSQSDLYEQCLWKQRFNFFHETPWSCNYNLALRPIFSVGTVAMLLAENSCTV